MTSTTTYAPLSVSRQQHTGTNIAHSAIGTQPNAHGTHAPQSSMAVPTAPSAPTYEQVVIEMMDYANTGHADNGECRINSMLLRHEEWLRYLIKNKFEEISNKSLLPVVAPVVAPATNAVTTNATPADTPARQQKPRGCFSSLTQCCLTCVEIFVVSFLVLVAIFICGGLISAAFYAYTKN